MSFIFEHKEFLIMCAFILFLIVKSIIKLTPTKKDDEYLKRAVCEILDILRPFRGRSGSEIDRVYDAIEHGTIPLQPTPEDTSNGDCLDDRIK